VPAEGPDEGFPPALGLAGEASKHDFDGGGEGGGFSSCEGGFHGSERVDFEGWLSLPRSWRPGACLSSLKLCKYLTDIAFAIIHQHSIAICHQLSLKVVFCPTLRTDGGLTSGAKSYISRLSYECRALPPGRDSRQITILESLTTARKALHNSVQTPTEPPPGCPAKRAHYSTTGLAGNGPRWRS